MTNQNFTTIFPKSILYAVQVEKDKNISFTEKLIEESDKKCRQYLNKDELENLNYCQKELMIDSSCVLLRGVNTNIGNYISGVHDCRREIKLAQNNLKLKFPNFPSERMDKWLKNLDLSIYSFA